MRLLQYFSGLLLFLAFNFSAQATLVSITNCTGAISCTITDTPPNPITANPNNGVLLAWDEVQNFTLTSDLRVDRVFDESATFIEAIGSDFLIKAGTIVSSHYVQWDPFCENGDTCPGTVSASINLDSQVFAYITADQNLFDSDAALGLPGLNYSDFGLRGLESGDTTTFSGGQTDINWYATSPGDWTRLITAFSPAATVPEPGSLALLGLGLIGLGLSRKKLH